MVNRIHEDYHDTADNSNFRASKAGWYQVQIFADQGTAGAPSIRINPTDGQGMPRSWQIFQPAFGIMDFATADPQILQPSTGTGLMGMVPLAHQGYYICECWMEPNDFLWCSDLIQKISYMGEVLPRIYQGILKT